MSLPTIPGYDVTELIGRGGMGRVYRATEQLLGRLRHFIGLDYGFLLRFISVDQRQLAV